VDANDERAGTRQAVREPYPAGEMHAYPVSTRVNNPKNDDPELLSPV